MVVSLFSLSERQLSHLLSLCNGTCSVLRSRNLPEFFKSNKTATFGHGGKNRPKTAKNVMPA